MLARCTALQSLLPCSPAASNDGEVEVVFLRLTRTSGVASKPHEGNGLAWMSAPEKMWGTYPVHQWSDYRGVFKRNVACAWQLGRGSPIIRPDRFSFLFFPLAELSLLGIMMPALVGGK